MFASSAGATYLFVASSLLISILSLTRSCIDRSISWRWSSWRNASVSPVILLLVNLVTTSLEKEHLDSQFSSSTGPHSVNGASCVCRASGTLRSVDSSSILTFFFDCCRLLVCPWLSVVGQKGRVASTHFIPRSVKEDVQGDLNWAKLLSAKLYETCGRWRAEREVAL